MNTSTRREQFLKIQEKYASELPDTVADISALWKSLCCQSTDDKLKEALTHLLHNLAGSGSSLGFPSVTQISRELEQLITHSESSSELMGKTTEVDSLLRELKSASLLKPKGSALSAATAQRKEDKAGTPSTNLIYLISSESKPPMELIKQLGHYGYVLKHFDTSVKIRHEIQIKFPCCFIMEISDDPVKSLNLAKQLKEISGNVVPLVIISKDGATEQRLLAVRAGANAFFDKPFRTIQLIDKLDELTERGEHKAYRILIVDDSEATANYYALSLENAGMETRVVTAPLDIMRHMVEFEPDLLLLDLYMPDCSGGELSEIIRQQQGYIGTPIVFLSAESNPETQIEAMAYGADEFLTKPVGIRYLCSVIKIRVKRFRQIKSLIVRDSLTGLYNHTHIKELLLREVQLSIRHGSPVQFAMIDIDHFKRVNDEHGHPTGDSVIKILSRLLKQSLRGTDIIGRYGGEEFAVILPDTEEYEAEKIINKIRIKFSEVLISSDHDEVKCTFSAGISGFPARLSGSDITFAADEALYTAKAKGRNQVCINPHSHPSAIKK